MLLLVNKDVGWSKSKRRTSSYECSYCGNNVVKEPSKAKSAISCGCMQKPHSMCYSSEYGTYYAMKQRCLNPNNQAYDNYGGRGIKVCERWVESFINFYEDMGPRPSKNHSIDRIDNDSGYSPDNCEWVIRSVQNRNHRRNVWIDVGTESLVIEDWCNELGVHRRTYYNRIRVGHSPQDSLLMGYGLKYGDLI